MVGRFAYSIASPSLAIAGGDGGLSTYNQIIQKMLSNLREAGKHKGPAIQEVQDEVISKPPTKVSYKVNFDTKIKKNIGTGLGMVIRDHKGQIIAAATKFMDMELCPIEAEAFSLRWASILVWELCVHGAIYETNCLDSVKHGITKRTRWEETYFTA
ncbi:hypothetical protein JHK82_014692 [Glycine max]|nr:hypothetical protein JHK85_015061 [Glycine max]KAG5147811.1 hypothetical protein JHK82_014692 [Glycine max]KAH1244951.1 hypothetical protein GmHk_06G015420 [Glycine max]